MNKETKYIGGNILEAKQVDRNGVPVGIVKGYIATWDIDRGADKFIRGAFRESIEDHREKCRQIRLKDHHGRTIGGFPIDTVKEDDRGLYGEGEINLDVQQGREAFALAKQGVLSDFSIGYIADDYEIVDKIREISKSQVFEGSIVDEPMNILANITEVKTVIPYQNLPLADRNRPWDAEQAVARVRQHTGSDDEPSGSYKNAFLWFDEENKDNYGAYKLPISDIVDGRMVAVPRGIFAAAGAMRGARGGVNIPEAERAGVIANINKYYAKMDLESPFNEESSFRIDDIESLDERTLEGLLKSGVSFSSKNAKKVVAIIKSAVERDANESDQRDADWGKVTTALKSINMEANSNG